MRCRAAGKNPEYEELATRKNFRKLNYHIKELSAEAGLIPGAWISDLNYQGFDDNIADQARLYY